MANPQVVAGGKSLKIDRVAANILNKQLKMADSRWCAWFRVMQQAKNSSPHKTNICIGKVFLSI
jgi:hypothetical protein